MKTRRRCVVLGVDAGSGGVAAALLTASSERLRLEGVTASWGALPPTDAAAQALMTAELLKRRFPIYLGCPAPLARGLYRRGFEREKNGRISPEIFLLPAAGEGRHAVDYLVQRCRAGGEKLTVAVAGPLTDLAAAIRIAPDLVKNIREVVVATGGAGTTDEASCPQETVFQDPEAAKIVIESGARVVIFPRAACRAALSPGYAARCRAQGGPAADLFARLLEGQALAYSGPRARQRAGTVPVEAVLCAVYLTEPSVVSGLEHARLDVCLDRGTGRGILLSAGRHSQSRKNVWVVRGIEVELLEKAVLELLRGAPVSL